MAKKKPQTRRAKLRSRVAATPADAVQASIRGDIARLQRLAMSNQAIPLSRVPKVPVINARKFGATGADLQYGEVIRELTRGIQNQDRQGAQNLLDLSSWYGTAKGSFETAAANNQRATEARVAEQAAADAAIAGSFGGGASEAAAALAQTAQGNQGFLRGLQTTTGIADQADIAQIEAEKAGALVRQRRTDDAREADLRAELGDKRFLRGRAAHEGELQARDMNWQRAMQNFEAELGVRDRNRAGRETRFNQLSSLPALKLSALMAGTQLTGAETEILNALDYPAGGGGGGGGGGTPRLANGMTPGEYARLMLSRDKAAVARQDKTSADVRKRRSTYFNDLIATLSGTSKVERETEDGVVEENVRNVRGAQKAVQLAVNLARSRGLDIRKPAVQELILSGLQTGVSNYDPNAYARLLAGYLPRRPDKKAAKRLARQQGAGTRGN